MFARSEFRFWFWIYRIFRILILEIWGIPWPLKTERHKFCSMGVGWKSIATISRRVIQYLIKMSAFRAGRTNKYISAFHCHATDALNRKRNEPMDAAWADLHLAVRVSRLCVMWAYNWMTNIVRIPFVSHFLRCKRIRIDCNSIHTETHWHGAHRTAAAIHFQWTKWGSAVSFKCLLFHSSEY